MPTVVYRAFRNNRKFDASRIVQQYMDSFVDREIKPVLIDDFDEYVENWKNKPEFKARKFMTSDGTRVSVYPAGDEKAVEIYGYVSGGTREHPIPKNPASAKTLAFVWGGPGSYIPKTTARGGYGGPGKVSGGALVFAKSVQHLGTEARNVPEVIKNKRQAWYRREMKNAWRRAWRLA